MKRNQPEQEILDRTRRIETRVTQLMVALGVGDKHQKPEFSTGEGTIARVDLPSPHSTLKEILDSIPATCKGPVGVFVDGVRVAMLRRDGNRD